MRDSGQAVVADFGLARVMEGDIVVSGPAASETFDRSELKEIDTMCDFSTLFAFFSLFSQPPVSDGTRRS